MADNRDQMAAKARERHAKKNPKKTGEGIKKDPAKKGKAAPK
jgi:hypothetical protein